MDETEKYPVAYIEALATSEERLARTLEDVVSHLRLGHLNSKMGLETQLLLIDAALKMRPDPRDACTGLNEGQS